MFCEECARHGIDSPVVGVCAHCGAALCVTHVSLVCTDLIPATAQGVPWIAGTAGRSLRCSMCRDAETPAAGRVSLPTPHRTTTVTAPRFSRHERSSLWKENFRRRVATRSNPGRDRADGRTADQIMTREVHTVTPTRMSWL